MVILPGHHSRKPKKPAATMGDVGAPTGQFASVGGIVEDKEQNDNKKAALNVPSDGLGAQSRLGLNGVAVVQEDFDEYGAELGPEARVWKTYVREADRSDSEKVDEWNKSLDIILIFAALFSAISTAFVIESTKMLKQDPADVSAQTLTLISQTLVAIANSSRPPPPLESTSLTSEELKSTRLAVCINVLWFLSLSLSVAVSLIAMLAKEWCHIFMSGRTGNPGMQAKRRQERLQALERWKMPEVLMFLPSLIHLALLLFAVGLCAYLWEIHLGVAIPVVVVTTLASSVYAVSTLLPFWHHLCPYSTTASRFIMELHKTLTKAKKTAEDGWKQDLTIGNALRWLIEQCETPRAVEIALQAIAGAEEDLPLDPLKECSADRMICQRLVRGTSNPNSSETVFELYARGFAMLHPPTGSPDGEVEMYNDVNALRRKIMKLQEVMERTVVDQFAARELFPTRQNLLALRIGSEAASCCLQSLAHEDQSPILEALETATELLLVFTDNIDSLHPAALHSLLVGTGMLFSCSLVHGEPSAVSPYALRLLSSMGGDHAARFGILYAVLALAQSDHLGWTHSAPIGDAARAERAIETVTHYASLPVEKIDKGPMYFGLVEFLLDPMEYHLDIANVTTLTNTLSPTLFTSRRYRSRVHQGIHGAPTFTPVHTLPQSFGLAEHTSQAIDKLLSNPDWLGGALPSQAWVQAILGAIRFIEDKSRGIRAPSPEVYVFTVASLAHNFNYEMGLDLMSFRYNLPKYSPKLASLVGTRNIIPLLVKSLESNNCNVQCFVTAQLLLFANLALHGSPGSPEGSVSLGHWFQCEELCNPRERLKAVEESLKSSLQGFRSDDGSREGYYADRVMNYVSPRPPET